MYQHTFAPGDLESCIGLLYRQCLSV